MPAAIDLGPPDLGDLVYLAGDPLDLDIARDGEAYAGFTFVAQIRAHKTADAVLAQFTVSTRAITGEEGVTDGTLEVQLHLDGDSAHGAKDGITRQLGATAYFDVQPIDSSGVPGETFAHGRLIYSEDVTR